ncbi:extracellular solute-binding protein [Sulfitobacter donghicola]|uniref:Peptide ABC transporter substrate-binding protein n=1 Tax=Sulfitobacter donghicola DSW-25 = KCTC 12864 = JCM 14565 TaxID=1300350 RepID=A0A073IN69_9RHOB|nr:extracellular solute-binding protein [Sulfitobacter donghicola]KEJ90936.1 peptide ABC transporter substrate-binding protein [Sulfitobacter donghicola DSW-25 = KCTC 12864 = JCM 14565]KIN68225.1 Oligopeptide/dipeptide uptake family ABC transporter, periplasmic substrate-binding protein [Sulfitobacter donghicola DSW-25 = KCTC 12864 = JCM 14565]
MPKSLVRDAKRRLPLAQLLSVLTLSVSASFLGGGASAQDQGEMVKSHGYSFYGDLSYPADFKHFNYVNPDAPKGGEISISTLGTFDSMNPYSRKGRGGVLSTMMYESLLGEGVGNESAPADVYAEYYCLLCETVEYPVGKDWVIFRMRPEAKFSNGDPVTAHDIAFSHNLLLDQGLKSYADAVRKRIPKVEVIDDHTVKFYFTEGISRRSLIDQVGFVPAWSKKWYEETGARLDESRLEISPGSGAYMVEDVDVNRRIVYKRNPDYWGRDLPFNVGRNNFDRIRVEYFGDENSAFEAFKSGEYTFRNESNSKQWATAYEFPKVKDGYVVTEKIADGSPPTPTGIVFNLGREILQDKQVREAVALAFNFEWTNESLQYGLFKQRVSFTQDTPLMATGLPEGAELAFLQELGDVVAPEMLSEEVRLPHTSGAARLLDRRNARAASKLLDAAGWAVGDDGKRRNAAGEPLRLTFLLNSSGSATLAAVVENFMSNLESLGIEAVLEKVDASQYTSRERDRDYDMVYDAYAPFLGTGTGLSQRYGSEAASYSLFNPAGLASPMVDAIIEASLLAETREEEEAAMMALDRALRHEFIMIPVWYNDVYWTAYYDQYGHPENQPAYALGYLDFWWYDAEKAEKLRAAGVLR